jgi:hypothetical protein
VKTSLNAVKSKTKTKKNVSVEKVDELLSEEEEEEDEEEEDEEFDDE